MITPLSALNQGLVKAYLEIVVPRGVANPIIPLRFNPTEFQLQKSNNFAEIGIPGFADARRLTAGQVLLQPFRRQPAATLRELEAAGMPLQSVRYANPPNRKPRIVQGPC